MKSALSLGALLALLGACAAPAPQDSTSADFSPMVTKAQFCAPDTAQPCTGTGQAELRNPAPASGNRSGSTMFRALSRLF
ncbi:hypothetical protein HMH01_09815 [Halovulum dunhuangense]|uniref:Lipoprotein n=1 Tax=Halovulum dunhuangense TaxID=1505036 RepID=A0A849L3E8_9RHOB|nr:hypothetical protein [Halovulum dunhuangense]NNU80732.1 hypothetical protein [Halovulum dunhuangense]